MNTNKPSYFTRVEDKYVFRVSTAFWHLLIGIITVAAIIGIVLLAWSLIPAGKEKIKASEYPTKAPYPPVESVNLADLNMSDEKIIPSSTQAPPPISQSVSEIENDPDKPAYQLSLSELKRIIPQDQWQPGSWNYPYGELAWQVHQDEPGKKYRDWIPSGPNVEQRLEESYKKIKANKYKTKTKALDSYLKILRQIPEANSTEVLNSIIYNMNDRFTDLRLLDSAFTLIATNLKTFSASKEAAQHLIGFVLNNPNATFDFIPFAVNTCNQISDSLRYQFLTALTSGFYNYFNSNVEVQKEATQQFISLLPQLRKIDLTKALRKFYSIYNQKNRKRNDEIARINDDYNSQIASILTDSTMRAMQAQDRYMIEMATKEELRNKSVYAIGGGFIAIALLGTILTLLSIQRILKRIENTVESKVQ